MPSFHIFEEDPFSPIRYDYAIQNILYRRSSEFGEVAVAEHEYFGRMLILDGVVQLTERDEYFYHEMIAHVPLYSHPYPEDVLIIGGGDGGTLREVLKHTEVQRVAMAEIDRDVIETSKRYFPTLSVGFGDPRLTVHIADGATFVAKANNAFDVIIVDCTDPVGPAESLFTDEFFSNTHSALKAAGIFAAQTESLHFHLDFVLKVQQKLRQRFYFTDLYTVPLATYAGNWWTFSVGSKTTNAREVVRKCEVQTKYYAEDVHRNAFLPVSLSQKLLGATPGTPRQ
ncbi:MAG: polyamine aminopropyltransferase [Chloroflexi bacterium]|nr:polyamine aminopropyltransferase [Chloroflexota bacterium]